MGNAISGILGLASLGVAGPFIVICCAVCCCIILSVVSSMFAMKSGGGSSGSSGNPLSGMHKGFHKGFHRGGNSDTENSNSDIVEYLGAVGVDLISDLISDSSL